MGAECGLENSIESILEENGFTSIGLPLENCQSVVLAKNYLPALFEQDVKKEALVSVGIDMQKRGLANELVEEVKKTQLSKTYEKPADTVNIHLDKVGVKKQKETRNCRRSDHKAEKNKQTEVQNTVAHIEHEQKSVTKTGSSILQVLIFVT